MSGFLTRKMMENLLLAGFDINKFYTDCFYESQFLIIETTRKLTKDEIDEMINDGDGELVNNAYIIENEEVKYVKIKDNTKLLESNAYVTLSTDDLITYLDNYFVCSYKICCEKLNAFNYIKIEYVEHDELKLFELESDNPSFDYLLYSFISYLLTHKKYLLQIQ